MRGEKEVLRDPLPGEIHKNKIGHSNRMRARLHSMARQIRIQREARKMSKTTLAAKVGCSLNAIWQIENENNFPSMPVYIAICDEFGLPKPPLT